MKKLQITREIEIKIVCHYRPSRPAPACSNPDSPAYSDPGDPEEMDLESISIDGIDVNPDAFEILVEKDWIEELVRSEFEYECQHERERAEAMK